MSIFVKKSSGSFIPAPAGSHAAVCVDVIDLGVQKVDFAGKITMKPKVKLV